jgi:hypothetical protein
MTRNFGQNRMKTPRISWQIHQSNLSPSLYFIEQKKKKKKVVGFYLRLLRTSAAAAATMTITTAPIARYVVAGIPLVGG